MIKHLGEGLVPFEDCGFSRYPEMPCAGEEIVVRCRMDANTALPILTLTGGEGSRLVQPVPEKPNYFAFHLGAFRVPQKLHYRIAAGGETTPLFAFDIVKKESVSLSIRAQQLDKNIIQMALAPDLVLTVKAGDKLEMSLEQGVFKQDSASDDQIGSTNFALALPGGFSFSYDPAGLWAVLKNGQSVCEAVGYELWRDCRGNVLKTGLKLRLHSRHILGTGERFDAVDQFGLGGNGWVVDHFTHQGTQTYLPVPFFITDSGFGWWRDSAIPAAMLFGPETLITQETEGAVLAKDILLFGQPSEVLTQFLKLTGPAALPPEWAFGVWISGNGWNSGAEVAAQLALMKRHAYPASVMVLEQWSDERTFYTWHPARFPDPAATVKAIRDAGLRTVLWQIPVIKHEWDGEAGEALEQDTREAIEKGYAVKTEDGTPYHVTEKWFHYSLLPDFTNPEAVSWWFHKREYLLRMGVEGFKTDGGEFLFDKSARLHDGTSGLHAHNLYPLQYAKAYHDFMRAQGVNGVTFSRAGYTGAQTVPIHWAGDQMSEWGEFQSQLRAGLSAGLSGVLFWGFDIGGFAGPIPDAELYLRATAMGCFCPVMQWHAEPRWGQFKGGMGESYNNDRSPWNLAEKLGDSGLLQTACRYAVLRESLRPYLWQEAQYCVAAGRPMMAHLLLDFPGDKKCWDVHDQYMLGRNLLVAPITEKGAVERIVYLPKGQWQDFFTGEQFSGGREITTRCSRDFIPVYKREASIEA